MLRLLAILGLSLLAACAAQNRVVLLDNEDGTPSPIVGPNAGGSAGLERPGAASDIPHQPPPRRHRRGVSRWSPPAGATSRATGGSRSPCGTQARSSGEIGDRPLLPGPAEMLRTAVPQVASNATPPAALARSARPYPPRFRRS